MAVWRGSLFVSTSLFGEYQLLDGKLPLEYTDLLIFT